MVQKLSGLIRPRKEESEFRMVLHYNMRTTMRNGYEFPEKMKISHFFFNRTSGPIFMLRAIPEKNVWEGWTALDLVLDGW